ncbi:hypothetical protein GOODEAATRI_016893 [Goodea atripinnis]|uniref:Uncharacterized protein n=1 Tax=Goodea atripinnis TaxID=208336 RepID=A0ABV0NVE0_9TELE
MKTSFSAPTPFVTLFSSQSTILFIQLCADFFLPLLSLKYPHFSVFPFFSSPWVHLFLFPPFFTVSSFCGPGFPPPSSFTLFSPVAPQSVPAVCIAMLLHSTPPAFILFLL